MKNGILFLILLVAVLAFIVVRALSAAEYIKAPTDGCRMEVAGEVMRQPDGTDSKILILKCPADYWSARTPE